MAFFKSSGSFLVRCIDLSSQVLERFRHLAKNVETVCQVAFSLLIKIVKLSIQLSIEEKFNQSC